MCSALQPCRLPEMSNFMKYRPEKHALIAGAGTSTLARVPAAAQCPHQRHRGEGTFAAQLDRAALDLRQVALGIEQVEVTGTAGLIQLLRQVGRAARRHQRQLDLLAL